MLRGLSVSPVMDSPVIHSPTACAPTEHVQVSAVGEWEALPSHSSSGGRVADSLFLLESRISAGAPAVSL